MTTTIDRSALLPHRFVIGTSRPDTAAGGSYDHVNPATGQIQQTIPMAGAEEVDLAVEAARNALAEWRNWPAAERRNALLRLASLLRAHEDELNTIASLETGVPFTQTPWFTSFAWTWLEDAAGWADKLYGDVTPLDSQHVMRYSVPEPFGVVGVLATWNGSCGAFGMAAAPALAAGCTVVIKPSELAPFGMLRVGELALEAGLPPGTVNVLVGGPDAGAAMVGHPQVDKITFTGSPATARKIAAHAAQSLTPCVFELGGKSASIIFDDADIDKAVTSTMSVIVNSGQQCTLGSRLLVHSSIHDRFADALVNALAGVRIGDPFDEGVQMGPVINEAAADRIVGMVERAWRYGNVLTGGGRVAGDLAHGFFVAPTVVTGIDNTSELAREEIFGPVLALMRFETEEEAVSIANDTDYGLAGYVFTENLGRAHRVASLLDTANVGVNGGTAPTSSAMPFGGRKSSGYGRQGGLAGVLEFVNSKTVAVQLD